MSMRKLQPGESPRQAMLTTMTEIVDRLKGDGTFDAFDRGVIALGMATWFAWTEKVNQYKMPMLSSEIEEVANDVMAAWGWEPTPPTPVDSESGPTTPEAAVH